MPKITYVEPNGEIHVVEAAEGENLMQVAVDNSVPGILGDCGGCCSCATCHVFVDEAWMAKVPVATPTELALLSGRDDLREASRLGCQIKISSSLDGLIVALPESQY